MPDVTLASKGVGVGNVVLPVIEATICCAYAARLVTVVGSSSAAIVRCV
jgi:hypothetical protein